MQIIKKLEKGPLLRHQKSFRKKLQNADKNRKGDPLVLSGFGGYAKKVKNERGTLLRYFPLTGLGVMVVVLVFSVVRKVAQSE